ncbi:uncharacterized protein MYCFIDRAFT_178991 [Pseudocercospora fijiensis CIRAD86]|uniref:Uncharacterized protein n=1 Tax=Pseudocercospora fijiensis (strain CIRAD86) TaxID=383855 RepID=M3AP61_PSEFD|nr:uncharacterized protein MYCFIDRAFT_178991 [Pseudocercospora fijiensis CIRAD86]EME78908.1 hypothetical protein MYCFIDRAFT_178991 [Pseudocercospora fijiensis CIRAD86]
MAESTNTLAFGGTGAVSGRVTSHLERLPVELFDHILSHIAWANDDGEKLKWWDRVWTLSKVSRTSKRLRQATEPALYADFPIPLPKKALKKLLWTVTTRPSLGRHIRSLLMEFDEECARKSPTPEQMASFGPALDVFKTSSWYWSLLQALAKGCHNAQLMLLLSLATEMQTLTYTYCHERISWYESCQRCPSSGLFLEDILSATRLSVLPENAFGNLRTVTLQAGHWASEISSEALCLFSNLPSLSELTCCGLAVRYQGANITQQKQLSNLQSLVLQRTSIANASLVTLMGCCRSLKRLDVDTADFSISDNTQLQIVDFGSPELARALERHINTLEYCALTNGVSAARVQRLIKPEMVSQISILKSCLVLRDLTVDDDHILGVCENESDTSADRMRLWEAIDLNSILPPTLSKLLVHSQSHFSLLKGILIGMSKYNGNDLRCLEVTFRCGPGSYNMEYKRSVESYRPYKDGTQPWLLDMVTRDVSGHRLRQCIRFRIVGPSIASRLHALVQTMPNEGLVPPQTVEPESDSDSDSDSGFDDGADDDDSNENEWTDEAEGFSEEDDSEDDVESNDEVSVLMERTPMTDRLDLLAKQYWCMPSQGISTSKAVESFSDSTLRSQEEPDAMSGFHLRTWSPSLLRIARLAERAFLFSWHTGPYEKTFQMMVTHFDFWRKATFGTRGNEDTQRIIGGVQQQRKTGQSLTAFLTGPRLRKKDKTKKQEHILGTGEEHRLKVFLGITYDGFKQGPRLAIGGPEQDRLNWRDTIAIGGSWHKTGQYADLTWAIHSLERLMTVHYSTGQPSLVSILRFPNTIPLHLLERLSHDENLAAAQEHTDQGDNSNMSRVTANIIEHQNFKAEPGTKVHPEVEICHTSRPPARFYVRRGACDWTRTYASKMMNMMQTRWRLEIQDAERDLHAASEIESRKTPFPFTTRLEIKRFLEMVYETGPDTSKVPRLGRQPSRDVVYCCMSWVIAPRVNSLLPPHLSVNIDSKKKNTVRLSKSVSEIFIALRKEASPPLLLVTCISSLSIN